MMTSGWPPSLKPIAKYVARGNEVEASNPVVAFYCNLYAVKEGYRRNTGREGEPFLLGLLEKTELLKKIIGQDDEAQHLAVESFALERFAEADGDDMAGISTGETAKKYFNAACYLDVCNVFKQSEEVATKCLFAKSRMIAIKKALREGSDPRRREVIKAIEDEQLLAEEHMPSKYGEQIDAQPSAPAPESPEARMSFAPDSLQRDTVYPGSTDESGQGMKGMGVLSASAFPEVAPKYQSFVDPTGSLHDYLPPSKPLPSIPTGPDIKSIGSIRSVSSSEPSAPYVSSPVVDPASSSRSMTSLGGEPSIATVKKVQANAKHAISALDFADYAGAVSFLEQALADLKAS